MKTMIRFYISTGANGIMHTLRKATEVSGSDFVRDAFVKNLSINEARAAESAKEYVDLFKSLIKDNTDYFITADLKPRTGTLLARGMGKLPKFQIDCLNMINKGVMPFGIHKGKDISAVPDDYLAWCAHEGANKKDSVVAVNLASASIAVLIDRGVINSNESLMKFINEGIKRKNDENLKSNYFGMIKSRHEIEVVVDVEKASFDSKFNRPKYFYKLRVNDDILIYSGSVHFGEPNSKFKIRATVSQHNVKNGVKSTLITRPIVLGAI